MLTANLKGNGAHLRQRQPMKIGWRWSKCKLNFAEIERLSPYADTDKSLGDLHWKNKTNCLLCLFTMLLVSKWCYTHCSCQFLYTSVIHLLIPLPPFSFSLSISSHIVSVKINNACNFFMIKSANKTWTNV